METPVAPKLACAGFFLEHADVPAWRLRSDRPGYEALLAEDHLGILRVPGELNGGVNLQAKAAEPLLVRPGVLFCLPVPKRPQEVLFVVDRHEVLADCEVDASADRSAHVDPFDPDRFEAARTRRRSGQGKTRQERQGGGRTGQPAHPILHRGPRSAGSRGAVSDPSAAGRRSAPCARGASPGTAAAPPRRLDRPLCPPPGPGRV